MGYVLRASKYYYGLDVLRATMMLLGIFIHAALLLNYYDSNYKSSYGGNVLISNIVYFFTLFRMECFFILSGFFGALIIDLKSKKYFIKSRIERVLLPLLFGLFFTNILLEVYVLRLSDFTFSLAFLLKHLWFLLSLIIISMVFLSNKIQYFYDKYFVRISFLNFMFFSLFFLFFKVLLLILSSKINSNLVYDLFLHFIIQPFEFIYYYFLGYLIYKSNKVINIFYSRKAMMILVPLLCFSIYGFNMKYVEMIDLNPITQLLKTSSDFFVGLIISVMVFEYFKRLNYQ